MMFNFGPTLKLTPESMKNGSIGMPAKLYDSGFSKRANAIAHNRLTATKGKIENRLGKLGPFTDEFKSIIRSNYLGIYEHTYLDRELKGAKMVLRALSQKPQTAEAGDLLYRMTHDFVEREVPCVLCPIWRHEQSTMMLYALTMRYFFEAVRRELFLATIVFGYAENLEQLPELISTARTQIDCVHKAMTKRGKGVVLLGAFEPDLRSQAEIRTKPLLRQLEIELQWNVAEHGGWVLSGHFIGRAPHIDDFEAISRSLWPSANNRRVRIDSFYKNRSIEHSLVEALSYLYKYAGPLFDTVQARSANQTPVRTFRSLQNAFYGPTLDSRTALAPDFDRHAAIRQWALFMDEMGPDVLGYSIETVHAQKWFSKTEMDYFRRAGDYDWYHGGNLIEVHRDTGPFRSSVDPKKKHMVPHRRTRPLTIDDDWYAKTDLTGVDPFKYAVSMPL